MRITENTIENFTIELLEHLGYQYIYAPDISHDSANPERSSYEDVLLLGRLQDAVSRNNPEIPIESQAEALKEFQRLNSPELISNNKSFHRMLSEGIKVSYQKDSHQRGDLVWLIDFANPENNDFVVANQFTVRNSSPSGNRGARPDVILEEKGLNKQLVQPARRRCERVWQLLTNR